MEKSEAIEYFRFLSHLSGAGHNDVREDVEEHLGEFLRSGVDPKQVMSMLGSKGVFDNYSTLVEYGVKVNLRSLAKDLGEDFVYQNLSNFREKDPDISGIVEAVCDKDSFSEKLMYSAKDFILNLVSNGVNAEIIFNLADEFLKNQIDENEPASLFNYLELLVQYGLGKNVVKEWLLEKLHENDCSNSFKNILRYFETDDSELKSPES